MLVKRICINFFGFELFARRVLTKVRVSHLTFLAFYVTLFALASSKVTPRGIQVDNFDEARALHAYPRELSILHGHLMQHGLVEVSTREIRSSKVSVRYVRPLEIRTHQVLERQFFAHQNLSRAVDGLARRHRGS